ncbi:MAG: PRC-barrel domain-containing protein [Candidatus Kerfeldbacteria bacterium]|nr:PRC-barrel domain-containing protein [Candidatus Kerfeldbacteria bacterium]
MEQRWSTKQLRDLPVYTKSGTHLGTVVDVQLDMNAHQVQHYVVRRTDLLGSLLDNTELLVAPSQVISVTKKKMVVDDTTTPVRAATEASAPI